MFVYLRRTWQRDCLSYFEISFDGRAGRPKLTDRPHVRGKPNVCYRCIPYLIY